MLLFMLACRLHAAESPATPQFYIRDLGDAQVSFISDGGVALLSGCCLWRDGEVTPLGVVGARVANREGVVGGSLYAGTYPVEGWHGVYWVDYFRAALWHEGETISLGTLGGRSSAVSFVNNSKVVVGTADDPANVRQPFIWQNGEMSPIRIAYPSDGNHTFDLPLRITENGTIFGVGSVAGSQRAVRLSPMTDGSYGFEDLGAVDGLLPTVEAFNDFGWAIGQALHPPGDIEAFQLREGRTTWLGTLDTDRSYAYAVNNAGDVVGMFNSSFYRAFLWREGTMFDLNRCIPSNSGWRLVSAYGINNFGQIVGTGILNGTGSINQGDIANGGHRAFMLNPVPDSGQGLTIKLERVAATNALLLTLVRQPTTNVGFERSSDLIHWSPIAHTTEESSLVVGETDSEKCFYRAVFSP
jgi:probable HAF family extracellular repeat protein